MSSAATTTANHLPLVCVIEDDASVRESVEDLIREEGFHVDSFESAESFLGRTPPDPPACLILDHVLPGMSGLELYDRIRADPRFPALPVVFETGGGREHAQDLRDRGVATYLKKPFDIHELVKLVKRLVPPRNGDAARKPR